ncbi:hypothetical protein B0W47_08535 [Komagataeibacter nataicola]|uniref:Polysaccharide biosynthesis protein n=1 Tax=Komagataeibacter nataicola TaxID=265960 RepID=A0A9N7CRG7_9PROT|nr:hypothetical protein B0W47_08535 [Komagataeibacter nataicola]PYD65432.1 polysaccharide biosynthesis protein [Komagataeibacter nataicola]
MQSFLLVKNGTNKSAFSRIISNTSIIAFGRVVNAVCSFIYIPWTVKTIGLDAFGQLLLITSYVMLISDITHLHSWQPLLHFGTAPFHERKHRYFHQILAFCMRSDMISGLFGMIVGIVGIMLFSHAMGWPDSICSTAELCTVFILFMNRGWPVGVMRLLNKFKMATIVEMVGSLTRTAGTFIGYELRENLVFFLLVWCATQFVLFLLYNGVAFWLVRKNVERRFSWQEFFVPTVKIPGIWKLTIGTSTSKILDSFSKQISTLLIGAWIGASDAAIFRVASQITNALSKPAGMLIPSLYPEFIRFRDEQDWKGLRHTMMRIFGTIALLGVAVLIISLSAGNAILDYMLHYHSYYGGVLVSILAVSVLIDITIVPLEPFLTVMGKVPTILRAKIFTLLIYMPVLFVFTKRWGIWGAASASVVASVIMFVWCSARALQVFSHVYRRPRSTT